MRRTCVACLALPVVVLAWSQSPGGARARVAGEDSLRYRILQAEDARAPRPESLRSIIDGLSSSDPAIVCMAARALGRLERPTAGPALSKVLAHPNAAVREEAANALGYSTGGAADAVSLVLRDRLAVETDSRVSGTLCRTLGRLPFKTADERRSVETLLIGAGSGAGASLELRLGVMRGLESLIRGARGSGFSANEATLRLLRDAALAADRAGDAEGEARIRRVALTALNTTTRVDATYARAMTDRDPQVRRLVIAGVAGEAGSGIRAGILATGLADADPMVRYEALRVYGRTQAAADCAAPLAAVKDANPHVALLAIDQLATACPGEPRATDTLGAIVFAPGASTTGADRRMVFASAMAHWHAPAHALVSLVRRTPSAPEWPARLDTLARDSNWHVREYAARAAEFMRPAGSANEGTGPAAAGDPLVAFAADASANVREVAIGALSRVRGHAADSIYLAAFDRPDYQVVIAACAALKGTKERARTSTTLLKTLRAITDQNKETSRDVRAAILDRLREVADRSTAEALRPYVSTYDLPIARKAANIVTALTGVVQTPQDVNVRSSGRTDFPTETDLVQLPSLLRVTMESGRTFDLRLYLDETPITAWRILSLVRAGYYNGLTFHRVVPNFVVQGGSPGANEVVGDGPFMRDEPGLRSNLRGTVGISTRGRDTGDAQIYINTVDSPRLDHTYYVFGEVVRGMDVVDLILEGDVIRKVEPAKAP